MELYHRVVGTGPPIVVLHGGPEFDHSYLRPELDRLAESFRLVYYDQRGRGRSTSDVKPEDVSIASEIEDLDGMRRRFGLDRVAVLGHSWGGLLAMEYATRRAHCVSHLILLNTAPASAADALVFREHLRSSRPSGDVERMQAIAASAEFLSGSLDAEAEYNRIHFSITVRDPERLEQLVGRLRAHFDEQGVLTARAIGQRLCDETWRSDGYDLVPTLRELDVPTLVLHGEDDFIPVPLAARVADAMPRARLTVLQDCGHFAYLDRPDALEDEVAALFASG